MKLEKDPALIGAHVRVRVDRMGMGDVREVMAIERDSFTAPWPSSAYRKELLDNPLAHYLVLRRVDPVPAPARPARPTHTERRGFLSSLIPRGLFSRDGDEPRPMRLTGYAGLWLVIDEAHITTIAVRPEFRGRGFGELLLASMVEAALDINARWLTLEVRVSNMSAQTLYRKYGFHDAGVRKKYYSDNNEDALIMWTDELQHADFQNRYRRLKTALLDRLESQGALDADGPDALGSST